MLIWAANEIYVPKVDYLFRIMKKRIEHTKEPNEMRGFFSSSFPAFLRTTLLLLSLP